jgi:hypothetical protein
MVKVVAAVTSPSDVPDVSNPVALYDWDIPAPTAAVAGETTM